MPNLIAKTKELLADVETPVSAFAKLCGEDPYSFFWKVARAWRMWAATPSWPGIPSASWS
jgi:hypothetical protein